MRYVTVRLHPTDETTLHPLGPRLRAEPSITREAYHRADLLADGTVVMLAEVRGDRDRFETVLDDAESVLDYALGGTDGRWYSYTHVEPTELSRRMLRQRRESTVMMEMPVDVHEDGSLELTFAGEDEDFDHGMLASNDAYDLEVLETGHRPPSADSVFGALTERQQDVLDAAVRLGYYENPRGATQADVADAVDATPSTVGEHLRKIESRIFSPFVRE